MRLTNANNLNSISNVFQQKTILSQVKPKSLNPMNDVLQRMSDKLTAQNQTEDLKKRFDRLELSLEGMTQTEHSSLEDVPDEMLEFYLEVCKFEGRLGARNEAALMEYRDQLSAFDQTIQQYQDILDGKAALPDQMGLKDVESLLEATKAARETFLQKGAEKLNRLSDTGPSYKSLGKAYDVLVNDGGEKRDAPRWRIDPSAEDIYDEIDRALASAHEATSTFQDIGSRISAELKRRGHKEPWVEFSLKAPKPGEWKNSQQPSLFGSIYEEIWNDLRQKV